MARTIQKTLSIENPKTQIIRRRMNDLRERLTVRTVVGEPFRTVKPEVDDVRLRVPRAFARKVLNED